MSKRLIALMLMLVMVVMIVPTASAQNACYTLAQEDCDVVNNASAQTRGATSFNQEFTLDISVTGLAFIAAFVPDLGIDGDIDLTITGSGPVAFTPDSADVIVFSADMTAEGVIGTQTVSGPVIASLVDQTLFLTLDGSTIGIPLAEAGLGDAVGQLGNAAGGLDLEGALGTVENPTNLSELLSIDEANPSTEIGDTLNMLGIGDFFQYLRLAEADVMGESTSPFIFTADLNGLIASDELAGILALGAGADGGAEMDQNLQIIRDAIMAELSITQYVGNDSGYIRQLDFNTVLDLDLGAAAGSPGMIPPIVVTIDFSVMLDGFNEAVSVVAPEGAEMVDPGAFDLGGMLGAGGF